MGRAQKIVVDKSLFIKEFGSKILWVKMNLGKKSFVEKIWSEKIWSKKNFGSRQFNGPKNLKP